MTLYSSTLYDDINQLVACFLEIPLEIAGIV